MGAPQAPAPPLGWAPPCKGMQRRSTGCGEDGSDASQDCGEDGHEPSDVDHEGEGEEQRLEPLREAGKVRIDHDLRLPEGSRYAPGHLKVDVPFSD